MSLLTQPRYRRTQDTINEEPTLTEQHHTDEVNIHSIIRKYKATGVISHTEKHQGTYGDFINRPDFEKAVNLVAEARTMFESVPAEIRAEFQNDPAQFLEFMQNPENRDQIAEFGFSTDHLPAVQEIIPEDNNPSAPIDRNDDNPTIEDAV